MKKPKKSLKKKKQEKKNFKIFILLFGIPLLLIFTLVFLFESILFLKENKAKINNHESDQFTESTFSAQMPEELFQDLDRNLPTITLTPTQTLKPTSTPKATPIAPSCSLCNYQSYLYWGPVIKSFVGGKSYTIPSNRLIASDSAELSKRKGLTFCELFPVGIVDLANQEETTAECSDPLGKKYLTGSIDSSKAAFPDGYMKGTVTNNSKNCTYEVGLAVYKSAKNEGGAFETNEKNNLYDYQMLPIKPGETAEIYVKTPMQNDGSNCHKIPASTVSFVSTYNLSPTPTAAGYNINVKSEIIKGIFGMNNNVKFSWEQFSGIADNISNIYIRRWDEKPPSIGKDYKEYKLKTDSLSFINNDLKNDIDYYYKYCLELKNFGKSFCTDTIEIKGGSTQELQAKIVLPQNLNNQVLGVSNVGEEEIFKEKPDLLRIIFRLFFRKNR